MNAQDVRKDMLHDLIPAINNLIMNKSRCETDNRSLMLNDNILTGEELKSSQAQLIHSYYTHEGFKCFVFTHNNAPQVRIEW